ncbi:MAG: hypothetical protein HZA25_03410 [Candidatus Niyogibacteria bacterium]|nr:hypothetical protein [Candidatus Niyogibacteria bacterium]
MFSWRARRQLFYLAVFAVVIGLIAWRLSVYFQPAPTCFDGVQNQAEQGTDCGGPCAKKCLGDVRDLTVVWTRISSSADGKYDVAALVDNGNLYAGLKTFTYRFKLYDERGVTVAIREGSTYLNPAERFVILESGIDTKAKVPKRAVLELPEASATDWQRFEVTKPNVIVARKIFTNEPFPTLEAVLRSGEVKALTDLQVAAVLYDEAQNVLAVSRTTLDNFPASGERSAYFTWGAAFASTTPANIDVFVRVNQTLQ